MSRQLGAARRLHELVFGSRRPEMLLVDQGHLPEMWDAEYLSALAEAEDEGSWSWPRQLYQAVHFVSCHLGLRYVAWCRITGRTDPQTENLLGRLQMESELFFWNSVATLPLHYISMGMQPGVVEQSDVALVTLCLKNNSILEAPHPVDARATELWAQQYRVALSAIGPKWHSTSCWWKWLVLAVRFSSFYLDLALILPELQVLSLNPRGLDPNRTRATLEGLRSQLGDSASLTVIEHWIRLSFYQRDSTGFPLLAVDSEWKERPSVGVRSVSEFFLQKGST